VPRGTSRTVTPPSERRSDVDARPSPLRYLHWSNLLSYGSLAAWLFAVHAAVVTGSWAGAGAWIALAALADMYDGKFAGLFDRRPEQRRFGMEMDSLVDAVAFGAGPVACVVALAHPAPGAPRAMLLAAGVIYLIATVTRLGLFNIVSHGSGRFIGVPTTIAGLLWSALFLAGPGWVMATVGLLVTGTLMVLPVAIPRPTGWRFLLFPAWALGMVMLHAFR